MTKRDSDDYGGERLELGTLLGHEAIEKRVGRITAGVSRRLRESPTNHAQKAFLSVWGNPAVAAAAVVGCLLLRIALYAGTNPERVEVTVATAVGIPAVVASFDATAERFAPRWLGDDR